MTEAFAIEKEDFEAFRVRTDFEESRKNFSSQGLLDVFLEMLDAFLVEKENRFQELQKTVHARNNQALGRAAHSLKGSFLSLGINCIVSDLLEIERQIQSTETDWETVDMMAAQINASSEHFARLARALLSKGSSQRR